MADTQTLVISLAKSLPNPAAQGYILYTDNLFTNRLLAKALSKLDIGIMGTTRVTASGLPPELIRLKKAKELLKWGHLKIIILDNILYFLWQDNNRVLGITTAYNLTDTVIRARKRPSSTSTSASITRPVFGDLPVKKLPIPTAINAYNHYMGGVDTAN
jgi:Transposase IS4